MDDEPAVAIAAAFARGVKRQTRPPVERPHIIVDPAHSFGWPTIARTRVKVADVLALLDAGEPLVTVCEELGLTRGDVLACCWYEARYGTDERNGPRAEWAYWLAAWGGALHSADPEVYQIIPLPPFESRRP